MKNVLTTLVFLVALSFSSFQNTVYASNELSIEGIEKIDGIESIETIIIDWEISRASVQATGSGAVVVKIYNSSNQIMDEGFFYASGSVEIDTESYPSGTYAIVAEYDNTMQYKFFVVE